MDGRPPEVVDVANGEVLKLACMACIRGHRTKHCGSMACRDKVLWTIKRPGRPSNSCMCKFSGTGRCKCVIAKAQCPHKPKKGEKKTVDCRCDERGRLCCTLGAEQWQTLSKGDKPAVTLFRTQEELHATISGAALPPGLTGEPFGPGQSPFSTPRTRATSMAGLTNGSGRSTPQTPMSALHHPFGAGQMQGLPQSPGGPPPARFGMMGIGAPMGSEDHVAKDVLSWQGQTPIAPTPRPVYSQAVPHQQMLNHTHPPYHPRADLSLGPMPYTFDSAVSQPPMFSPHHEAPPLSHPATPLHQPHPGHHPQYSFDTVPPVTASFNELSMAANGTLPAISGFDMDYFNFQFPGAICQQCGMADCTCRSCPTVLQNTMDGSWQQCCSRKHVRAGPQPAQAAKKGCCGSKTAPLTPATGTQAPISSPPSHTTIISDARNAGGCCAGSSTQDFAMDPFDFGTEAEVGGHDAFEPIAVGTAPHSHTPIPHLNTFPHQPGPAPLPYDQGIPLPHTHPPDPPFDPTVHQNHHPHHDDNDPFAAPSHAKYAPHTDLDFDPDALLPPEWQDGGGGDLEMPDLGDMDFDQFIQEEAGCGCGTNCPCGMDDVGGGGGDMEVEEGESPASAGGGCCGGGG